MPIHDKRIFFQKVELAASFQRSGRQSEVSHDVDLEKYKLYENQDAINFRNAANSSTMVDAIHQMRKCKLLI
ncbi:MAG: hypothetical protein H0X29_00230 [Parachlamydiaceae bacterium]|nr:hypothetical protein [Parachlamydiaceae bacterium]